MKLKINKLSQRDARWRLKKLGNSDVTLGAGGCLLTCHSMAFQLAGIQQTPDVLNETYKANDVYHSTNLIHFWSIPNVFPNIRAESFEDYYDIGAPIEKFYEWLDRGLPVIVLVDFDLNPNDGIDQHFILLHGYDDTTRDFFCIDPWTGEEYYFNAKYGDPARFIYGHRFYSWEVQHETTDEDKIADLENKIKNLEELLKEKQFEIIEKESGLKQLADDLKIQEAENTDLGNQLFKAREEKDDAVRAKTDAEKDTENMRKKLLENERRLESQLEEITRLKSALVTSDNMVIDKFSGTALIVRGILKIFKRK